MSSDSNKRKKRIFNLGYNPNICVEERSNILKCSASKFDQSMFGI